MHFTMRQKLSVVIGFVLLQLMLGIWLLLDTLSYPEPYGYSASGVSIVACVVGMGGLAVLLLLLLLAWQGAGTHSATVREDGPTRT
jgi:hypothetical protein